MLKERKPLVCVVDDDDAVRESVSMLLATLAMEVRPYRDCMAFLGDPGARMADCLVLDVRLPGVNGLEFQSAFAEEIGRVPVIFISGHGDIPMAVRAMRQGALDFLQKPFGEQALIDRVNQAVQMSSEMRLREASAAVIKARLDLLTPREREVFDGMLAGRISKVIGDDLGISTRTVEQHRARVMEKMRANTVADLFNAIGLLRDSSGP